MLNFLLGAKVNKEGRKGRKGGRGRKGGKEISLRLCVRFNCVFA